MSDVAYIRGEVPFERVPAELTRLRPWRWFNALLLDWSVIALAFAVFAALGTPIYLVPVAAFVIGSRQHSLALLGHDGAHFLVVRHRRLNDWLSQLFISWPLLICIKHGYRPWHFAHHRELGSYDDPELSYRSAKIYQGNITWMRISLLFIGDICGLGLKSAVGFLIETFPSRHKSAFLAPTLVWTATVAGFCGLGLWWVPALWAWSIVSGFYAIFRVRTYTEHVGVAPAGKSTSHRFTAGWFARMFFFPHNTWCHYEHHKWPQIPFYNLPALRRLDHSAPILSLRELFPLR